MAALARGIDSDTVRIGVIKSGSVFGDVELGVRARLARANAEGGLHGRQVELAAVVDDGGDPAVALELARQLVDEEEVFAVVLATAAPQRELTDFLASSLVPFFGWGFAPGFCDPNEWGLGFNGCLNGSVLGVEGARADPTARELITTLLERSPTAVLVASDDLAGMAATAQASEVWAADLVDVLSVDPSDGAALETVVDNLATLNPDVALLSVGLEATIELKGRLGNRFDGVVVDDVAYLPGLLANFATAAKLEGGYSVSQFPPQEEYREVTAVLATDLQDVGGGLIYSQAVSLGYWATDLFVALLDAVGVNLDTATFFETVNLDGVDYAPSSVGAPCSMNTLDIHRSPAGGGALVRVEGGIYRPVVAFACIN